VVLPIDGLKYIEHKFHLTLPSIPDGATILSAVLSLYGFQKYDNENTAPNINIYTGQLVTSTTPWWTTTPLSTAISYTSWVSGGWNNFTLNADGLAAISKTGVTYFAVLNANYDVAGNAPVWAGVGWIRLHVAVLRNR